MVMALNILVLVSHLANKCYKPLHLSLPGVYLEIHWTVINNALGPGRYVYIQDLYCNKI